MSNAVLEGVGLQGVLFGQEDEEVFGVWGEGEFAGGLREGEQV